MPVRLHCPNCHRHIKSISAVIACELCSDPSRSKLENVHTYCYYCSSACRDSHKNYHKRECYLLVLRRQQHFHAYQKQIQFQTPHAMQLILLSIWTLRAFSSPISGNQRCVPITITATALSSDINLVANSYRVHWLLTMLSLISQGKMIQPFVHFFSRFNYKELKKYEDKIKNQCNITNAKHHKIEEKKTTLNQNENPFWESALQSDQQLDKSMLVYDEIDTDPESPTYGMQTHHLWMYENIRGRLPFFHYVTPLVVYLKRLLSSAINYQDEISRRSNQIAENENHAALIQKNQMKLIAGLRIKRSMTPRLWFDYGMDKILYDLIGTSAVNVMGCLRLRGGDGDGDASSSSNAAVDPVPLLNVNDKVDFNRISSILFHLSQQLSLGEAKVYAGTGMGRHTVLHMLARHNIFEKSTQATPSVIEIPVQSLINQHQNNANKFNRVLVLDSFNNCVPPVQTMHATVAAIPNSFASLNQHREQLNGAGQAITVLNKEGAVVHESIHVGTILCGKNLHTVGQRNLLQSWKNSRQSNLETMTQLEQMKLKLDVQKWDKFDNYSLVLCSIVEGEYLRLKISLSEGLVQAINLPFLLSVFRNTSEPGRVRGRRKVIKSEEDVIYEILVKPMLIDQIRYLFAHLRSEKVLKDYEDIGSINKLKAVKKRRELINALKKIANTQDGYLQEIISGIRSFYQTQLIMDRIIEQLYLLKYQAVRGWEIKQVRENQIINDDGARSTFFISIQAAVREIGNEIRNSSDIKDLKVFDNKGCGNVAGIVFSGTILEWSIIHIEKALTFITARMDQRE